jgi:PhnB protein
MKNITTYIHFAGNCRQAMQFYQKCLGGELTLMTYLDASGKPNAAPDATIMHSQITRNGSPMVMASDTTPEGPVKAGNNFSVSVDCESVEEIERLFTAVGANGKVRLPLSDMPWGARFGMLTDSFGIQWIFNCALGK